MKEIVVMWVFEEDSYQNVLDLRKRYFNVASDHHPHITFAHYLSIDEDELIKHIDTFIQSVSPFEVTFDKVMLLNQYVVLTTPFDNELKRYYALFHKANRIKSYQLIYQVYFSLILNNRHLIIPSIKSPFLN